MERLQKVIAEYGITSRRKAEDLIKNGHVEVNGILITELGTKVNRSDIISVDGANINNEINKVVFLMNKPREVICSVSDDKHRKTVVDLIRTNERIYPIGRLDYDTTGLILLTNDGELANILMHPHNNIEKKYIVKINGILSMSQFKLIKRGIKIDERKVEIDHIKTKKIDKKNNTSIIELTIHEGRNHIIRRLFESIHYDVLKLTRVSYANLTLEDLKSGDYRELSPKEIKVLYSMK